MEGNFAQEGGAVSGLQVDDLLSIFKSHRVRSSIFYRLVPVFAVSAPVLLFAALFWGPMARAIEVDIGHVPPVDPLERTCQTLSPQLATPPHPLIDLTVKGPVRQAKMGHGRMNIEEH